MEDNQRNNGGAVKYPGPGPQAKKLKFYCNTCGHSFSVNEKKLPWLPLNGSRGFEGYIFYTRCYECGAVIEMEVKF